MFPGPADLVPHMLHPSDPTAAGAQFAPANVAANLKAVISEPHMTDQLHAGPPPGNLGLLPPLSPLTEYHSMLEEQPLPLHLPSFGDSGAAAAASAAGSSIGMDALYCRMRNAAVPPTAAGHHQPVTLQQQQQQQLQQQIASSALLQQLHQQQQQQASVLNAAALPAAAAAAQQSSNSQLNPSMLGLLQAAHDHGQPPVSPPAAAAAAAGGTLLRPTPQPASGHQAPLLAALQIGPNSQSNLAAADPTAAALPMSPGQRQQQQQQNLPSSPSHFLAGDQSDEDHSPADTALLPAQPPLLPAAAAAPASSVPAAAGAVDSVLVSQRLRPLTAAPAAVQEYSVDPSVVAAAAAAAAEADAAAEAAATAAAAALSQQLSPPPPPISLRLGSGLIPNAATGMGSPLGGSSNSAFKRTGFNSPGSVNLGSVPAAAAAAPVGMVPSPTATKAAAMGAGFAGGMSYGAAPISLEQQQQQQQLLLAPLPAAAATGRPALSIATSTSAPRVANISSAEDAPQQQQQQQQQQQLTPTRHKSVRLAIKREQQQQQHSEQLEQQQQMVSSPKRKQQQQQKLPITGKASSPGKKHAGSPSRSAAAAAGSSPMGVRDQLQRSRSHVAPAAAAAPPPDSPNAQAAMAAAPAPDRLSQEAVAAVGAAFGSSQHRGGSSSISQRPSSEPPFSSAAAAAGDPTAAAAAGAGRDTPTRTGSGTRRQRARKESFTGHTAAAAAAGSEVKPEDQSLAPQQQQPAAAAAGSADSDGLPALTGRLLWLYHLTTTKGFFKPCELCSKQEGRDVSATYFDLQDPVSGPMCHQCASSSDRDGHRIVQVRRSTYHEVLKMNEAQGLLDVTDVQPYVINAAKVLFLRPRPQPRPPKGVVMPSRCLVDGRQLMDNGTLYCSIRCKYEHEHPDNFGAHVEKVKHSETYTPRPGSRAALAQQQQQQPQPQVAAVPRAAAAQKKSAAAAGTEGRVRNGSANGDDDSAAAAKPKSAAAAKGRSSKDQLDQQQQQAVDLDLALYQQQQHSEIGLDRGTHEVSALYKGRSNQHGSNSKYRRAKNAAAAAAIAHGGRGLADDQSEHDADDESEDRVRGELELSDQENDEMGESDQGVGKRQQGSTPAAAARGGSSSGARKRTSRAAAAAPGGYLYREGSGDSQHDVSRAAAAAGKGSASKYGRGRKAAAAAGSNGLAALAAAAAADEHAELDQLGPRFAPATGGKIRGRGRQRGGSSSRRRSKQLQLQMQLTDDDATLPAGIAFQDASPGMRAAAGVLASKLPKIGLNGGFPAASSGGYIGYAALQNPNDAAAAGSSGRPSKRGRGRAGSSSRGSGPLNPAAAAAAGVLLGGRSGSGGLPGFLDHEGLGPTLYDLDPDYHAAYEAAAAAEFGPPHGTVSKDQGTLGSWDQGGLGINSGGLPAVQVNPGTSLTPLNPAAQLSPPRPADSAEDAVRAFYTQARLAAVGAQQQQQQQRMSNLGPGAAAAQQQQQQQQQQQGLSNKDLDIAQYLADRAFRGSSDGGGWGKRGSSDGTGLNPAAAAGGAGVSAATLQQQQRQGFEFGMAGSGRFGPDQGQSTLNPAAAAGVLHPVQNPAAAELLNPARSSDPGWGLADPAVELPKWGVRVRRSGSAHMRMSGSEVILVQPSHALGSNLTVENDNRAISPADASVGHVFGSNEAAAAGPDLHAAVGPAAAGGVGVVADLDFLRDAPGDDDVRPGDLSDSCSQRQGSPPGRHPGTAAPTPTSRRPGISHFTMEAMMTHPHRNNGAAAGSSLLAAAAAAPADRAGSTNLDVGAGMSPLLGPSPTPPALPADLDHMILDHEQQQQQPDAIPTAAQQQLAAAAADATAAGFPQQQQQQQQQYNSIRRNIAAGGNRLLTPPASAAAGYSQQHNPNHHPPHGHPPFYPRNPAATAGLSGSAGLTRRLSPAGPLQYDPHLQHLHMMQMPFTDAHSDHRTGDPNYRSGPRGGSSSSWASDSATPSTAAAGLTAAAAGPGKSRLSGARKPSRSWDGASGPAAAAAGGLGSVMGPHGAGSRAATAGRGGGRRAKSLSGSAGAAVPSEPALAAAAAAAAAGTISNGDGDSDHSMRSTGSHRRKKAPKRANMG